MAPVIRSIFIDPPIAVARLGGSNTPQDAYLWVESPDPRSDGETTIAPTWSLTVLSDGSVEPKKPDAVVFRDGPLIRPVCPFLELWALMGEPGSAPDTWTEAPLTPALLAQHGVDESAITVRVDAHNLKAARRTANANLGFGTFPPVEIKGDNHDSIVLFGVSPAGARPPMIPKGRNIPLGSVQIMRSRPNPPNADFSGEVDIEILRLRFTPGRGRFYGPPAAATAPRRPPFPAIDANNAFLDPRAGWFGARMSAQLQAVIQPADTYDGSEQTRNDDGPALGVVDDTCEARIEVTLALRGGAPMKAVANVFAGPPDFAPDRRPFLSLADELNDRAADATARNAAMSAADLDAWVEDLFERIYETVSLLNVDHWRSERGLTLTGNRLRAAPIAGDGVPQPRQALGGQDAMRNPDLTIAAPTADDPLPLSTHARMRHRTLADLQSLRDFIAQNPDRLAQLVRQPFEIERQEGGDATTMRMPPFMRHSNAEPLTLSVWQYQLLMAWAAATPERVAAVPLAPQAVPLSEAAERRRSAVLARLAAAARDGGP
jgi:hypothetical protein